MALQNDPIQHALECNKSWASSRQATDPNYFTQLSSGQAPPILWIGCSDSRVPETTILGLQPGDVFVTRNIANIVHASDLSSQCVIEYAVKHLRVQHVVLCGHTSCGGAKGALGSQSLGLLEAWLHPLRALRQDHLKELDDLEDDHQRLTRLVELNVEQGVRVLKQNPNIVAAVKERGLQVHGMVFEIEKGTCRLLDTRDENHVVEGRKVVFESIV